MSETKRVDPTVAGLLLIGFITLVFGIVGIQIFNGDDFTVMFGAAGFFLLPLAGVMLVFAYMAGKCGNAFATALFAYIAVAFLGTTYLVSVEEALLFYIVGFFFIVFALVAALIGAPKLLVLLLIFVAALFIFFGIFYGAIAAGDDPKAYAGAIGIFGILSFLIATYMAVALATEKFPVA